MVCVLTAVFLPTPLHAQAKTIPEANYWQLLADLRTEVAALETAESEDAQAVLQNAVAELESITAVSLADGGVVPIQSTFLIKQLTREEPNLEEIGNLLDAMLAEKEAWPDATIAYNPETMSTILAGDEFNYTPEEPNFLQKLWTDMNRQLSELAATILTITGLGGVLPIALKLFGAVALAFVVFYSIRGLVDDFIATSKIEEDEFAEGFLTADLALKRADEFSTGGDYRTAVRYLYLSTLLLLEEGGALRYDRTLTNREYLRTIAHKPHLAAILRNVIDVFDRVWYGFQPISKSSYDEYARQVDSLKGQKGEDE